MAKDSALRAQTILLVEDEVLIRMALADHLLGCGYGVVEAGSASEALDILGREECSVDLVFTDVRMPGDMDGLDLANWVRKNRPGLPVILASGDLGRSVAVEELCAHEIMSKPYSHELAEKKIREMMRRHRA